MSLILHIDTATETAQVSLAKDAVVLRSLYNESQKDHGAFLQPAIQSNSTTGKNILYNDLVFIIAF